MAKEYFVMTGVKGMRWFKVLADNKQEAKEMIIDRDSSVELLAAREYMTHSFTIYLFDKNSETFVDLVDRFCDAKDHMGSSCSNAGTNKINVNDKFSLRLCDECLKGMKK